MERYARQLLALAVAAPLALGACGPDEETDDLEIDEPAAEAPAPTTSTTPASIRLDPIGSSGIEGEVSTMTRGEDVELTLALAGLTAEGDYTAVVAPGACPMTAPGSGTDMGTDAEEGDEMAGGEVMDEEIQEIDLQVSGNSATGSATIASSELAGGTHIAIRDDMGTMVACGDLGAGGTTLDRPAPPTDGGTDDGVDGN